MTTFGQNVMVCLSFLLLCFYPLRAQTVVKGVRGGEITLTCNSPKAVVAHPAIIWEKRDNGITRNIATSVSGIPHISEVSLKERAILNGGNLTISSLVIADSGVYTCTVTAIQASPLLSTMELIVTATPRIRVRVFTKPDLELNGTYVAATCEADAGKPKPVLRWTDSLNQTQMTRDSENLHKDGSWIVRSQLVLHPGLLKRPDNSTDPVSAQEKMQPFTCHVTHENLQQYQTKRRALVQVLYPPITHISLLGNRLTCHAEGNPRPASSWVLPNGNVVKNSSLYIRSENENGKYSCRASSRIKPDSIEILDVQRAGDLPALFRTVEKLDSALPVTAAGYELACSAEIEGTKYLNLISFEWRKNNDPIDPSLYEVTSKSNPAGTSSRYSKLTSTLRFVDVVQGRDDALFRCRLVNRSAVTAFVTAVERVVNISVDYPPTQVDIVGNPKNLFVVEGSSVTMKCSSNSKPISIKEWYFNDVKIAVGNTITLKGILREEAGVYRCLAYNYVPGSALAVAKVTVAFPPSDVAIEESGGRLFCRSRKGSFPPPVYSWIYPNNSRYSGNNSEIDLLKPPSDGELPYTCVVSNSLGFSVNATYLQLSPMKNRIGGMSVGAFVVVIAISFLIMITIVIISGWWTIRRKNKHKRAPDRESGKNADTLEGANNIALLGAENPTLNYTSIGFQPTTSCVRSIGELNTPQSHSTKQFRSFSDPDPSSIEITAIDSLRSNTNQSSGNVTETIEAEKNDVTKATSTEGLTSPQKKACATVIEEDLISRVNLSPVVSTGRLPETLARSCASGPGVGAGTGAGAGNVFPVQYIPQNTLPRNYFSRVQFHMNHAHPVGVLVSPFDSVVFDPNWHSSLTGLQAEAYVAAKAESNHIKFSPTAFSPGKPNNQEIENCTEARSNRPWSSGSFSESTSGRSLHPGEHTSNNPGVIRYSSLNGVSDKSAVLQTNKPVFSSTIVSRKHQSLTLV